MPSTKTKYLLLVFAFLLGAGLHAQKRGFSSFGRKQHSYSILKDSTVQNSGLPAKNLRPKRATLMAAVLPGSGQIYNKKYWKAPIVWGGIGLCVYFIQDNTKNFNTFSKAYIAEVDGDPNTVNTTEYNGAQLDQLQETYRRWRDLSYVSLAAVYLLQMLDANVDAHLFYFDVNEDLSMQVTPWLNPNFERSAGLSLNFNF